MGLLNGMLCHECFVNIVHLTKLICGIKKEAGKSIFVKENAIPKGLSCYCRALECPKGKQEWHHT